MGFRFKRSIKILPGIRINFNKNSHSISIGPRGAKTTFSKNGVRKTIGLPGSGLSYTTYTAYKGKKTNANQSLSPASTLSSINTKVPQSRSLMLSYVLLVFGLHYFYLRKPLFGLLFLITVGGCGFWLIIDIFRLPRLVKKCNQEISILQKKAELNLQYNEIQRDLDILQESSKILVESTDISTIDSRYGTMIQAVNRLEQPLETMSELEDYQSMIDLIESIAKIKNQKTEFFNESIDRIIDKLNDKLNFLKTVKARKNNINKLVNTITTLENMPDESKQYALTKLSELSRKQDIANSVSMTKVPNHTPITLEELQTLKNEGIINNEEYKSKARELLGLTQDGKP
ncbi:DUF4236 domain-containing protein [Megasphaera vaginalis (ex Srinivasan et al. 2021)]|uniref:TM2 domain protein n=1 Tax=Megasphaera vaginalis (ex Srinivasan et al. 2021) TaxID=1111454 RepID=U7UN83_9FIRM|nr:DUF4236 domain-containing protein [Megasphaera vaginalis (ex Srinivasan et al. 2021)]ERT60770.1 TM2 domain protein [Megasphaera vaginalis (ex Srinivasan et al. 2021)]